MIRIVNFDGDTYTVNLNFTHHAIERMTDRCVTRNRIIACIERGFGYVLDDAEINLSCPHPIYTRLIHSRENFKVVLLSRWNYRRTELNVLVITIMLDLFNPRRNVRKYKHTKIHTV